MIEMIGVLAIIALLSIGSLLGYNQAMLKFRLNKQSTLMTQLYSEMLNQRGKMLGNVTPYMIKMGAVPSEMVKPGETYSLYGPFQEKYQIFYYAGKNYSFSITLSHSPNVKEICQNLLSNIKIFHNDIYQMWIDKYDAEGIKKSGGYLMGDMITNNPCRQTQDETCFRWLTLSAMEESCRFCDDSNVPSCTLTFTGI